MAFIDDLTNPKGYRQYNMVLSNVSVTPQKRGDLELRIHGAPNCNGVGDQPTSLTADSARILGLFLIAAADAMGYKDTSR